MNANTAHAIHNKTLLTRTSEDHPRTSVLTKVRVIRKVEKTKATVFNYVHCKCNANSQTIYVNVNSYCLQVYYCSRFFLSLQLHVQSTHHPRTAWSASTYLWHWWLMPTIYYYYYYYYYYQRKWLRWHKIKRLQGHLTVLDSVTVQTSVKSGSDAYCTMLFICAAQATRRVPLKYKTAWLHYQYTRRDEGLWCMRRHGPVIVQCTECVVFHIHFCQFKWFGW